MLRRRRDRHRDAGADQVVPEPAPVPDDVVVERLTRDPLTGATAPWLLEDRLGQMIRRVRRTRRPGALLLVDVDQLGVVNEALGRSCGDELLRSVVDRIRSCLRDGDTLGRVAGDEFAVVVDELSGADDAVAVAESILSVLRAPFRLGGDTAVVSVSIGMVSVDGKEPVTELRRRAELALFRAKNRGGGRWAAFEGRTAPAVDRRLQVEWGLRRLLDDDDIEFRYRPVVELRSGALGLVRSVVVAADWPDVGAVRSEELRLAAASAGIAQTLLRAELSAAAKASADWPATVPVVVGLPAHLLSTGSAAGIVLDAWTGAGGPLDRLVVVVEDAATIELAPAPEQLRRLRERGVRVALDLGGGSVSLQALRTLPADVVVVGGPLLAELSSDRTRAVVGAVLGVAEVLGAAVMASDVVTSNLLDAARSLGIDLVEGDRIGVPVAPSGLAPWFSAATARG